MLIENAAGINAKRLAEAHETNSRLISRLRLKSFLDAARKPDKGAGMLESKKKRVGEPTRFVLCELTCLCLCEGEFPTNYLSPSKSKSKKDSGRPAVGDLRSAGETENPSGLRPLSAEVPRARCRIEAVPGHCADSCDQKPTAILPNNDGTPQVKSESPTLHRPGVGVEGLNFHVAAIVAGSLSATKLVKSPSSLFTPTLLNEVTVVAKAKFLSSLTPPAKVIAPSIIAA
jgi:hypothetical protein